jgi:hypothetical protein
LAVVARAQAALLVAVAAARLAPARWRALLAVPRRQPVLPRRAHLERLCRALAVNALVVAAAVASLPVAVRLLAAAVARTRRLASLGVVALVQVQR